MAERSVDDPTRCWPCGYPIALGATVCTECGAHRSEARERWSRATRISALDAARAQRQLDRIRRCAIILMIGTAALLAWAWVGPMLFPKTVADAWWVYAAIVLPIRQGVMPWVAVLGLWRVLHGRWTRLLCIGVLAAGPLRVADVVVEEFLGYWLFGRPMTGFVFSFSLVDILLPAATLTVLVVAMQRLATGLRWPWRYALVMVAAGLSVFLSVAWAGAFLAANTDGLGAWQPTLSRMLQMLSFSSMLSSLMMLFMSAMMVGVVRALGRRLR